MLPPPALSGSPVRPGAAAAAGDGAGDGAGGGLLGAGSLGAPPLAAPQLTRGLLAHSFDLGSLLQTDPEGSQSHGEAGSAGGALLLPLEAFQMAVDAFCDESYAAARGGRGGLGRGRHGGEGGEEGCDDDEEEGCGPELDGAPSSPFPGLPPSDVLSPGGSPSHDEEMLDCGADDVSVAALPCLSRFNPSFSFADLPPSRAFA